MLVVCAELCSLHVRTSNDPDTIMGSALFADGAAAAIVTAREHPDEPALLQLDHFETVLTPVGEESMAWNIGDEGFEMVLGNYVPHIIDDHIIGALEPLLSRDGSLRGLPYRDIRHWAIHPGGRSILDKVQSRLELSDEQLVPARETLRNYGNMSSATVLFVLRHILDLPPADGADGGAERICSMAFGPGLTVETALFTKLSSPRRDGPPTNGRGCGPVPVRPVRHRPAGIGPGLRPVDLLRERAAHAVEEMDLPGCDPVAAGPHLRPVCAGEPGRLRLARHLPEPAQAAPPEGHRRHLAGHRLRRRRRAGDALPLGCPGRAPAGDHGDRPGSARQPLRRGTAPGPPA